MTGICYHGPLCLIFLKLQLLKFTEIPTVTTLGKSMGSSRARMAKVDESLISKSEAVFPMESYLVTIQPLC